MSIATGPYFNRALKSTALGLMVLSLSLLVWVGAGYFEDRSSHPGETSGTPSVGGPFSAVDQSGRAVTEKDFLGTYMLAYFGYTSCPDVCPGELQIIAAALDMLGTKADSVTPVFFTVDPQRDTPAVLAEYLSNFYESMVGLTGTAEQMAAVASSYSVFFADNEDNVPNGDRLIDHSSLIFLMDREGRYVRHFRFGATPEEIATALDELIP